MSLISRRSLRPCRSPQMSGWYSILCEVQTRKGVKSNLTCCTDQDKCYHNIWAVYHREGWCICRESSEVEYGECRLGSKTECEEELEWRKELRINWEQKLSSEKAWNPATYSHSVLKRQTQKAFTINALNEKSVVWFLLGRHKVLKALKCKPVQNRTCITLNVQSSFVISVFFVNMGTALPTHTQLGRNL